MPKPSSPSPLPPPWILVIDDEPLIRSLIEKVLSEQGWENQQADGAKAAFALVQAAATPPTVMICDVLMPLIDGLELTRQMLKRVPRLNVILISGHMAESAFWPDDLGPMRLLKKPFLNEELVAAVREALFNAGLPD